MNQKEMAVAVEKMETYVARAEQGIATRKKQCELMQDEFKRLRQWKASQSIGQITGDRGNSGSATGVEASVDF